MSYLADVKDELEQIFIAAFEAAWRDVVEPALKQSYKNGVADGRAGKGTQNDAGDAKPRRQWGTRTRSAPERREDA